MQQNRFCVQQVGSGYREFKNFQEKDLYNVIKINDILRFKHTKRYPASQRNLYNGKLRRAGHKITYSEEKNRRYWEVNVLNQKYQYSEILQRKISVKLSSTALRMVRKYGGFDNYILLSKPKDMDSRFGEYLRRLMLIKLNNKDFEIPYIVQQKFKKMTLKRIRHRIIKRKLMKRDTTTPAHLRYEDRTIGTIKRPEQMSKKDYEKYKDFFNPETLENIQPNHPVIKEFWEEINKQKEKLEPERKKIEDMLKKFKNKNVLRKTLEVVEEGQRDFRNPQTAKD